jgi:hypothetical protein
MFPGGKVAQIRDRVSLRGLIIVLSAAGAIVFLILSFTAAARYRTTLIGVASAWGLAFVGSASTATAAARKSRTQRRNAYREFLDLSDELVAAHERLDLAKTGRDEAKAKAYAAQKQYESYSNTQNGDAAIAANAKLSGAGKVWTDADNAVTKLQKDYAAAVQAAGQLAPPSVRPAFEALRDCPPQDTPARSSARSAFAKAVGLDPAPHVMAVETA